MFNSKINFITIFVFFIFTSLTKAEIVNKLEISGNERVSKETIKVYGDFNINQDLNRQDLNKILKNLYSTNFFEDVKIRLEKNILYVNVKEYPVINQLIIVAKK